MKTFEELWNELLSFKSCEPETILGLICNIDSAVNLLRHSKNNVSATAYMTELITSFVFLCKALDLNVLDLLEKSVQYQAKIKEILEMEQKNENF